MIKIAKCYLYDFLHYKFRLPKTLEIGEGSVVNMTFDRFYDNVVGETPTTANFKKHKKTPSFYSERCFLEKLVSMC